MKKTFKNIRTLAALLIASAAFTACSNEDGAVIGEQPAQQQAPQVFTLTLQAGKTDGAGTRALALDGTKLVAKWAADDELTVINVTTGTPLGGTLTASNVSADGQTCTFSGTLTGTIAVDNQLALHYHATSGTQDGTLESAAANDQAFANVTVASVEAGNITISGGTATFNTTTAVLKLTLKDGSANALKATSLKMTIDGVDIFTASPTAATYTANGDGVLYFAVPRQIEAADKIVVVKSGGYPTEELLNTWMTNLNTYPVTFTATVGSDTYTATKTGYKLAGGKYYATELTMAKLIDLSTISSNYEAKDGEILTGTLGSNVKISIADNATVTLKDVDINGSGTLSGEYAGISCEGNATIILEGTNTVKGLDMSRSGIEVPVNKTLTIQGSGSLAATGNSSAAGIGSGSSCGNIVIMGGNITATGGVNAAGIGGSFGGSCGDITISGGTVTATGGESAAGIGGGNMNGTCGTITITSGVTKVTATKGSGGPCSIGKGKDGQDITVSIGGTEYASGISQSPYEYPLPALSLTNPTVGQVIGSDGKNYAANATLPTGVTQVAMIAYVDGENHGLAIALADESGSMNWATAKSTCEAKTPAFTGGTWKLPSLNEWKNMLTYDGDLDCYTKNNLKTALSTAGGNSLQEWMYYWSSTDYVSDNTQACDVSFQGDDANFSNESKTYTSGMLVRAVLAF